MLLSSSGQFCTPIRYRGDIRDLSFAGPDHKSSAAHGGVEAVEHLPEALGGVLGPAIFELDQDHVERGALDQSAHLGRVLLALDETALPVARHQPLLDLDGAVVDQGAAINELTAILSGRALAAVHVGRRSRVNRRAHRWPRGMARVPTDSHIVQKAG